VHGGEILKQRSGRAVLRRRASDKQRTRFRLQFSSPGGYSFPSHKLWQHADDSRRHHPLHL
jgi:hypothetical protein